jgi:two-component system NtrC family sensor kinase
MMGDSGVDFARKHDQYTVLVVDDGDLMRGVLKEILRDSGFHVVAVQSAEQAVWCLSKLFHIDVVFSDIKMLDIDGFALARWVQENMPHTPVILASGYSGKTNIARDLCGAQLMKKPYDFDHVLHQIRETAARRRPLES